MTRALPFALLLALGACVDGDTDGTNEEEEITTVTLTFSPVGGGDDVVATFQDLQDGNAMTDDITLEDANDYTLTVTFLNELEDPAEDVTEEIEDEDDEHQIFFTGDAVAGPASTSANAIVTQAYGDMDGGGLPIGLTNDITTDATGSGTLTVTLRHLPEEDGMVQKEAGLAATVASDGFTAIGGDNDVDVDFNLTVE